ncbi:MAG TPA: site-specific integrase, partial [Ochrobactrum intermedium]
MRASLAIENFLEMMSAERGAARNTLESYRRDLEAVAEAMAARGVNLAEAGADHVRSAIDAMAAEGFAATSQARRLSALRQFFRFLYSEGYRQDDPTGTVDAPKKQKPLPKIMSVENVTRLLD